MFERLRKQLPLADSDPVSPMLDAQLAVGEKLLGNAVKQFIAAGGKELYFVVTLADEITNPAFALVNLKDPKAGPDKMLDLLQGRRPKHLPKSPMQLPPLPFKPQTVEPVGRMIFAGSTQALARVKSARPTPRPELAKAFASAGDAVVRIVFIPTADSRRVVPGDDADASRGGRRGLEHGADRRPAVGGSGLRCPAENGPEIAH